MFAIDRFFCTVNAPHELLRYRQGDACSFSVVLAKSTRALGAVSLRTHTSTRAFDLALLVRVCLDGCCLCALCFALIRFCSLGWSGHRSRTLKSTGGGEFRSHISHAQRSTNRRIDHLRGPDHHCHFADWLLRRHCKGAKLPQIREFCLLLPSPTRSCSFALLSQYAISLFIIVYPAGHGRLPVAQHRQPVQHMDDRHRPGRAEP